MYLTPQKGLYDNHVEYHEDKCEHCGVKGRKWNDSKVWKNNRILHPSEAPKR